MTRALKYDIPGIDWRLDPENIRDGVSDLFRGEQGYRRLTVEIGFGRGEFLLEMARQRPNTALVGVDVSFKRVLKMARRLARTSLETVRLLEGRGEVFVKNLLPPGSVSELWVNFSDPWPKDRHAGRRLIQPPLVADAARALAPCGVFYVATDDETYAKQIDLVLRSEPLLENRYDPDPWRRSVDGRRRTAYEQAWLEEGRSLHFFEYGRRL